SGGEHSRVGSGPRVRAVESARPPLAELDQVASRGRATRRDARFFRRRARRTSIDPRGQEPRPAADGGDSRPTPPAAPTLARIVGRGRRLSFGGQGCTAAHRSLGRRAQGARRWSLPTDRCAGPSRRGNPALCSKLVAGLKGTPRPSLSIPTRWARSRRGAPSRHRNGLLNLIARTLASHRGWQLPPPDLFLERAPPRHLARPTSERFRGD